MNLAHLHLIMNHLPVIGVPVAAAFLAYGLLSKQVGLQKFSLLILFLVALFAIPVYLTGEPAEGIVEHIAGVSKSAIDPHEDAAGVALALTLVTGACSLGGLIAWTKPEIFRYAVRSTLILALVATIALIYVANLGGQIRHSEIRDGGVPASSGD